MTYIPILERNTQATIGKYVPVSERTDLIKPVSFHSLSTIKLEEKKVPAKTLIEETVKGIPRATLDVIKQDIGLITSSLKKVLPGIFERGGAIKESIETGNIEPIKQDFLKQLDNANIIKKLESKDPNVVRQGTDQAMLLAWGFMGAAPQDISTQAAKKAAQGFAKQEAYRRATELQGKTLAGKVEKGLVPVTPKISPKITIPPIKVGQAVGQIIPKVIGIPEGLPKIPIQTKPLAQEAIPKELQPLAQEANKIQPILKEKYPNLDFFVSERGGEITLSKIIIPSSERGKGIGTKFMEDLIKYSDETGQRILLTPTKDFGGTVSRLNDFYKRFGFVSNKGKSIDFSTKETMIRIPIKWTKANALDERVSKQKVLQTQVEPTIEKLAGTQEIPQTSSNIQIVSSNPYITRRGKEPTFFEEIQQKQIKIEAKKEAIETSPIGQLDRNTLKTIMDIKEGGVRELGDVKNPQVAQKIQDLMGESSISDALEFKNKVEQFIEQRKELKLMEQDLNNAIREQKSQEIIDRLGEKTQKHQEKMINLQEKYPKLSQLIQKLSNEAEKGAIRGYKLGVSETTQQMNKLMREIPKDIFQTQNKLVDIIKTSELELSDKAKFLSAIKNTQTIEQLNKVIPDIQKRIAKLEESSIKRGVSTQIDKELKTTKPIKLGEKRVEKYDYENSRILKELRNNNNLNQETAQVKLNELPTEKLSEVEKIQARFLSYKANGMKASVAIHEQVLADINELKRIGAEAKDEADFIRGLERQEKIDDVLKGIENQKPSKIILSQLKTGYLSSVANLYSSLNSIAGKSIADKYDYGMFQTKTQDAFGEQVDIATNKAMEIYDVKNNKELTKIFLNDLAPENYKLIDTDGFTQELSRFNLIDINNSLKNQLRKEQFYNAFGETQVNSLLQNLTLEDINLGDYLMEEVQKYKEVMNQRSIDILGRDMGVVENYWPSKSEHTQEFYDDFRRQGETPSAIKERAKSSKVVPKIQNAWLNFQRHIAQAEHVKTLSPLYEELKRIFSNGKLEKVTRKKFGNSAYESLMNNIETFSLNKTTQKLDLFSGGYNIALNNWVKAKIASPTVFARQLISSIYSIERVGIKNFTKYQSEIIVNPKKAFDFMWNNVPFIKNRFGRGYSEALQDAIKGANNLKIGMGSITKYGTLPTRIGDVTAIMINGYPIIKADLAKGMTMEEAINDFQKFTEKTQQSGTPANLSSLQRERNAFARTFLRFKNTTNQLLRLQVDANIQFINKQISAGDFATKTFLYSIYTPMMYVLIGTLITGGFKALFGQQEEKEGTLAGEILQNTLIQPFQAIPLLDATAEAAYSEVRKRTTGKDYYLGGGLFSYPLLDDITTAWQKITKKEPTAYDMLRIFSLIQEPSTGIPTETILRYFKYAGVGGVEKKTTPTKKFKIPAGLPELPSFKKTLPTPQGLPKLPKTTIK